MLRTLGLTLANVAAFVGLMWLVGARLLPWLLDAVVRTGSRELFTLAVVTAALGIAYGPAAFFGVPCALEVFFASVVINKSDHSQWMRPGTWRSESALRAVNGRVLSPICRRSVSGRKPVRVPIIGPGVSARLGMRCG